MTKAEWEGIFREAWDLVLQPRACGDGVAPLPGLGLRPQAHDGQALRLPRPDGLRGAAPPGGRPDPHQAPPRPPPGPAHREPADLLSEAGLRVRAQVRRGLCHAPALQAHPEPGPGGAGGGLHGRRHGPGGQGGGGAPGTVHRHGGGPAVRGEAARPGRAARRGGGGADLGKAYLPRREGATGP